MQSSTTYPNQADLDAALQARLDQRLADTEALRIQITDTYTATQNVSKLGIETGDVIVFLNTKPANGKLLAEAMELARSRGIENPYFMVQGSEQHIELQRSLGAGAEA